MFSFFNNLPRRRPNSKRRSTYRCVLEELEDRTLLSTFRVTTTSDIPLNRISSGSETLRSAVRDANKHAGHDKIKLGSGRFRLSIAGRVEDSAKSGDLDIRDDLTIVGAGAGRTIIDASALDRVFQVFAGINLKLQGVTITGGVSATYQGSNWKIDTGMGAGILNEGQLTIVNSIITGNSVNSQFGWGGDGGGGIHNRGPASTVYITKSIISENSAADGGFQHTGGGIKNVDGTVTIASSTFSGNTASTDGGGISNSGTLRITNSTITGNVAEHSAGAIWNSGDVTIANSTLSGNTALPNIATGGRGGAIVNTSTPGRSFGSVTIDSSTISGNSARLEGGAVVTDGGTISITNSTISGNRAGWGGPGIGSPSGISNGMGGGGIASFGGVVNITDSTIVDNATAQAGGGLLNSRFYTGAVFVRNSIVARNSAAIDPDVSDKFTSLGHNFIGDVGLAAGFIHGVGGDIVGGNLLRVFDPLLGSLQDNGGPTWTHALLPDSLAIDAGDTTSAADQRGVARPQEANGDGIAAADIGAFELKYDLVAPTVTGPTGSVDATAPPIAWNIVKGAVRYEVWIADLSTRGSKAAYTDQATGTSWDPFPALAPGHRYRIWMRAHSVSESSDWSAPVDFEIEPLGTATVTAPAGTVEDITPEITWTAVDRAERYEVWINDLTTGRSKIRYTDQATGTSWNLSAVLAPGHRYRIWMRALAGSGGGDWSGPFDFAIEPLGDTTVTGPAGTIDNANPEITWTEVSQAERYEVWVADLTSGGSKAAHTDQVTGTSWIVPAALKLRHSYRVWVRAHAGGVAGRWSAPVDFEVQPLLTPTVAGPIGSIDDLTPEITWTSVNRAERYEVWISDLTTRGSEAASTDQATGTSWTVSAALAPGHRYRIRVRALAGSEFGKWSAPVDFEIKPLAISTVTGPAGTIDNSTPEITWTEVDRAERYEVWIADLTAGNRKAAHTDQAIDASWTIPDALAVRHTYRVWVRALAGGVAGSWSAPVDFEVQPLLTPTVTGPIRSIDDLTPEITWTAVDRAERYEVWISDLTNRNSKAAHSDRATGTSWVVSTALSTGHRYRIWVRALAGDEFGKWSDPVDFEIAI